jgi:hypothetical protein
VLNLKARHNQRVLSLTFSPDATILVAAAPGELFVFRGLPNPVRSERTGHQAIFIPGSQRVLVVGEPGALWDLATGVEEVVSFGSGYWPTGAATPDGRFVLFTRIVGPWNQRQALLFARDAQDLPREGACWSVRLERPVLGAPLVTPESSRCIVALEGEHSGEGYGLREYAVQTGQLLRAWQPKRPRFGRWVLSPDGRCLVVAQSGLLRAFNLEKPEEEVATVKNKGWKGAPSITFHPSGRWLAVWHNGPTVKLFDTDRWKLVSTFTWGIGRVQSVAFSADGFLGAAGGDTGKIVVWDFDA